MVDSHEETDNPQEGPTHNSEVSGNLEGILQLMAELPSKDDLQTWGKELKQAIQTETSVLKQEITAVRDTLEELEAKVAQAGVATESNSRILYKHDQLFIEVLDSKDPPKIVVEQIHRVGCLRGNMPRDVLCCLASFEIKEHILQKAHSVDGIHFEDSVINLYQDLSASTVMQRRLLKPLTTVLREQSISYKWGFPFALLAHKGGKTYALHYPTDVPLFWQQLDIRSLDLQEWHNYGLGTIEEELTNPISGTSANQNPRGDSTLSKQWRKHFPAYSPVKPTPSSKRQP
ncbi:hypothetical protein XELAEV_18003841mg [Xenopus laevis]|nr:hypothetical protein XELAEV_18003841mg [Xenopus laevis]